MNLLFGLDIVSVFFFGLSGTLTGIKYNKLDLVGLVFVAFITAVGGGTVRDVVLDAHPIAWTSHSAYFVAILSGYLVAVLFGDIINQVSKPIITVDALGYWICRDCGVGKGIGLRSDTFYSDNLWGYHGYCGWNHAGCNLQ